MQAVIFTEAGINFGLGHLSRCVALKHYLTKSGFDVEIYLRGSHLSPLCQRLDWITETSREDLEQILSQKPIVFVDSYYASFELCQFFTQHAKVCVFFDDFNRMQYPKDSIILNGALNSQKYYIDVRNEMFLGIEYFLLREEFRQPSNKIINKEIGRILITLGGNDEANNTQKILEIVEKECCYAMIDIVVGDIYKPISYGFNTNIHSHLSANTLRNLILDCDLAISGGGITMVEIQSTKTPSIALQVAPNQAHQLRAWQKEGLRVAQNIYQIKSLLKTLRKFKDRKKLSGRLERIKIGEKINSFIQILIERYNS